MVKFDARRFSRLVVADHGSALSYYEAYPCSCAQGGARDPSCTLCTEHGWRYKTPVTSKALFLNLDPERMYQEWGEIIRGGIMMSVPHELYTSEAYTTNPIFANIGLECKVIKQDEAMVGQEILVKGTNDILRPTVIVDVLLVADVKREYVVNTDYKLNGQTIEWQEDGQAPPASQQYSVRYRYRPEFKVYKSLPQPKGQPDLPKRLLLVPVSLEG